MSGPRNLHPDPRCLKARGAWNGSSTANGEKWRYERNANVSNASVGAFQPLTNAQMRGMVLYARVTSGTQSVIDNLDIEQASTIVRRNGWVAARVLDDNTGNHTLYLMRGPLVLEEVGVYTPDDWEQLYALYQAGTIQFPWVAGPRDATAAGQTGPWEL